MQVGSPYKCIIHGFLIITLRVNIAEIKIIKNIMLKNVPFLRRISALNKVKISITIPPFFSRTYQASDVSHALTCVSRLFSSSGA